MAASMRMASATLLTADELCKLPDPDLPHELVRGVLRLVTYADATHGSVCSRVLMALARHVHPRGLGELFTEGTGFLLERNPDTVRCPDVAFVAHHRLPAAGLGTSWLELAPDLAVEVVSKNDRRIEVEAKVADYLRFGVRSVWVALPAQRAVRVYDAAKGSETVLGERNVLDGGDVLPGFTCPVASLFVALHR